MGKPGYFDRVAAPRGQALPVMTPLHRQFDPGVGFVEAPAAMPARPRAGPLPISRPELPTVSRFAGADATAVRPVASPGAVALAAAPEAAARAANPAMPEAPPRAAEDVAPASEPAPFAETLASRVPAARDAALPAARDAAHAAESRQAGMVSEPENLGLPPVPRGTQTGGPAPFLAAPPPRQMTAPPPGFRPAMQAAAGSGPSIHIGTIEVRAAAPAAPPPAPPARPRAAPASPSPSLARPYGWRHGFGQS